MILRDAATRLAKLYGMNPSVPRGRWGPCCSTAPQGMMQTFLSSTASLISGQVSFS